MLRRRNIVESTTPPSTDSLWLNKGIAKVFINGEWASGVQGPKGDKGDTGETGPQGATGPAGTDGKSITAISLTTNGAGQVTGGNATLSDGSSVPITVN